MWIASAILLSLPALASSVDVLHGKTRAELSAENGQFSVEPSMLNPAIATRYYDSFGEVASDSSVAPKGAAVAQNSIANQTWIRQLARLGQRELDLTTFIARAEHRGIQVLTNQAESFAQTGQIGLARRLLRSEPFEEMIHVRQLDGVFDKAVKAIRKSSEFRYIPGNVAQRLAAAREIHAKQLLLNRNEVFQLNGFNRLILRLQLNRLWKYGITRGY